MTESLAYPGDTRRLSVGGRSSQRRVPRCGRPVGCGWYCVAGPACQGLWGPGQPGGRHGVWGVHDPPVPLFLLVPCLAAVEGEAGVSSIGPLLHFPADYGDLCPPSAWSLWAVPMAGSCLASTWPVVWWALSSMRWTWLGGRNSPWCST